MSLEGVPTTASVENQAESNLEVRRNNVLNRLGILFAKDISSAIWVSISLKIKNSDMQRESVARSFFGSFNLDTNMPPYNGLPPIEQGQAQVYVLLKSLEDADEATLDLVERVIRGVSEGKGNFFATGDGVKQLDDDLAELGEMQNLFIQRNLFRINN